MATGGAIEVAADGDWSFPIGTVLRKDFAIEGKLVETRLLMHHDDGAGQLDGGWAGYSYRWDAAEKEAVLVESGAVDQLANGQVWTFPSGADCLRCHTEAAGRTLGDEPVPLAPDQRQTHVGPDDVEIRLNLTLTQMELVRELTAALARGLGNVFDDVPDTPKTVRHQPLTFHRPILKSQPHWAFFRQRKNRR